MGRTRRAANSEAPTFYRYHSIRIKIMAVQSNFLGSMTLKALLEDPNLKNPPKLAQSSDYVSIKKEGKDLDAPIAGQPNYGSAFLGADIWNKASYEDLNFNLEYMDLDEFLCENGMEEQEVDGAKVKVTAANSLSPRAFLRSPPTSPSHFLVAEPSHVKPTSSHYIASASPKSTPPGSPIRIEFQVSEQDLALSSIPGQEEFDPRRKQFSEEELKPQPVIKKSRKVFVPEEMKDDKYWARRNKNNFAAKRSRDARRVKENQIAMRAAFLEKENGCLKDELTKLRKENTRLKAKVTQYEVTAEPSTASFEAAVAEVNTPTESANESFVYQPSSPISIAALAFS